MLPCDQLYYCILCLLLQLGQLRPYLSECEETVVLLLILGAHSCFVTISFSIVLIMCFVSCSWHEYTWRPTAQIHTLIKGWDQLSLLLIIISHKKQSMSRVQLCHPNM